MTTIQPQTKLIEWVKGEGGFFHEDAEVVHHPKNGFYVQVRHGKTIRSGTRIASCPMSTTLSILNAMDVAPFRSHGVNFPASFISKQPFNVVQYFFLMEQHILGAKSWWAPYLAALPSPNGIDSMHFSDGSEEDMRWIAGTNLRVALAKQNEKWRDSYIAASQQLKNLRWPNAIQELYTWKMFLWAAIMFGSRSFTSQVLSDTAPADRARPLGRNSPQHEELSTLFSDGFSVLLPLLDILNYKPGAQVEWQARYSYVGLQVLSQFDSEQEVCNNYGPRDNETLMVGYGFAIASNPFDHYSVGLRVPPGSPLTETRSWNTGKREEDYKCYIFTVEHPRAISASCLESSLFSFDLLDSISVLSANDRELQAMMEAQKTYISERIASKTTEDNRNLLHTFVQLHLECQARLNLLRASDPTEKSPLLPDSPKQQFAQIYRDSQMSVLETAVALCKYVLLRARTEVSNEEIIRMATAAFQLAKDVHAPKINLEKLIDRHTSIVRSHELLSYADLLRGIPPVLSIPDSIFAKSLESPHVLCPPVLRLTRFRLAHIVAFLAYSASHLDCTPRIVKWVEKLKAWYPPDDPNWSTLPEDEDGWDVKNMLLSAADFAGLSKSGESALEPQLNDPIRNPKWCTLSRLSWGWNVVGEESVQIPGGLLEAEMNGEAGNRQEAELLLYIPNI